MFKSLLYTIPTLSGNVSISCALNQNRYNSSTNEYDSFVQAANLVPLQNDLIRQPILVNLLEGNWEYDIAKFYSIYESSFYESNYNIYPYDYEKVDLMGIKPIDSRDKNYEFGCKRLNHHVQGYQFSFYAPFYIDNENDIPDCFKLKLEFDNNITKIINIYIGDRRGTWNYLRNYIGKYASKLNDNVIYLLSETNQCSCDGINVKHGGFAILKDDQIGQIYYNQMTINLFDNIITETFKRTKMVMKQIIPLAFMFNINDFLEGSEKRRLKDHPVKITGAYYKNGIKLPFYAFDNNYTNYKIHSYLFGKKKYKDVNDNDIVYYSKIKEESESLTSLPYPSLHEADYFRYKYTNKLNCMYCPWKLKYSSDTNPYIFNMTFAFKHYSKANLISSNIYGEFPVFIDTIDTAAVFTPGKFTDITLSYINVDKEENKSEYENIIDENDDLEKYYKIRNNHVCDWFTPYNESTFFNESNWTPVNNNKCYHKGVLYNLSYFDRQNYIDDNYINEDLAYINNALNSKVDKFGVFVNFNVDKFDMNNISNIKTSEYTLNTSKKGINMYAYKGEGIIDPIIADENYISYETSLGAYSHIIPIYIDSNKVFTYGGKLGEIFTAYSPDSTYRIIPEKYAYSYDLNSFFIDYSNNFNTSFEVEIDYDALNEESASLYDYENNRNFGYVLLPMNYENFEKGNCEMPKDNDKKAYIWYSRNDLSDYEKLNSYTFSDIYLSDTNTKYYFYKRYPIKEKSNSPFRPKNVYYTYAPICDMGNNIYSNALLASNYSSTDKYIYVDEYDMNVFLKSYNEKFGKTFDTEIEYITNVYKESAYLRFTNVEHLQKWPKYISRDKEDNMIYNSSNIFDNIYLRKRIYTYTWDVYDRYIPISSQEGLNIKTENQYHSFINTLYKQGIYFVKDTIDSETGYTVSNKYDLFFKKKCYAITEKLYNAIIQDLNPENIIPLQLYVQNYDDLNNIDEKYEYLTVQNETHIDYNSLVNTNEYLIPLFSNIYINDSTQEDMINLALSGNISINYNDENDEYNTKYVFFNKFHNKCMISLQLYTEYNRILDGSDIDNLDNNTIDSNTPYYVLRDFSNLISDNLPNVIIDNENVIQDSISLNHITDSDILITFLYSEDGETYEKYGMYYIDINCSNTKHTFRFRDNSSMIFYTINGEFISNENLYKLIPYMNTNIFSDFIGKRSTIIIPSTFILKAKYFPIIDQLENSINRYKHLTSHNNTEDVYDIKFIDDTKTKIKLNRYTDYITPYIKEINNILPNRFNKIFKLTNKKFDEKNLEQIDLNIYKHNDLRIGTQYDYINHESTINDIPLIEYKHFNDNWLYNLEESFEVEIKELLSYNEMLEKETFKETFDIFSKHLVKYNNNISLDDKDIILFLYNRYNISYVSVVKQLNAFKDIKLYKLTYKFTLI